jgi:mono/diheme cytochrome c family protein
MKRPVSSHILVLSLVAACSAAGSSDRQFPSIGRAATADEIKAWDIDFNPGGANLPAGSGTYARGVEVYAKQCASCHGPKGEGMAPFPKLVGAEPTTFTFAEDTKLTKTIGNYWPYATTLYDYVNRAMPFATPGVMPPSDVYAVVAFLLAENGVITRDQVMDAASLPKVKMPARDRFVMDDRKGGAGFR